ncbi:hypothetical protein [Streptomyces sp. NBC_00996]|uniref:hypothetical protein n=1 Tax=Streptomyces sp. NBC_00996 TaxID=2903710 RepID=UPI0038696996|nr:hypothetical protein OG390_01125 [Streptomyces sp. NBC_00996]
MRRMQYLMREVVANAADNAALEADRVDIMSALAVARECCRGNDLEQCWLYIRAVGALARFLGFRNALSERVVWGKSALEVAELIGDDSAIAELCASTIAWPLLQLGDYPEAERYCLEGLKAAQRCGDSRVAARWAGNASRSLSGIARDADDGPKALYWAEQAAIYGRRCDDELLTRGAKLDFGYAALLLGNFEEAERLFAALLAQEERGGDEERIGNRCGDAALAIMNRALRSDVAAERTRLCDQARANVERSLRLGEKIKHAVLVGECELSLATLARIRGDEDEHRRLMANGRRRFEELGIRRKGRAEQFVTFPEVGVQQG